MIVFKSVNSVNFEWEFFLRGYLKWNVDVFRKVEDGRIVIGGVFRDWYLIIRCIFFGFVVVFEINEAEM